MQGPEATMAIDVSSQVAKADQAAAQRKYDMAIDYYLAALQIDPDHRGARRGVRLAALRRLEHNYPSGLSIKLQGAPLLGAIKVAPKAEQKISACEAYLKIDPRNAEVALLLARSCEQAGFANAAIGVNEAIVEFAPKETAAYVNLGRLLQSKEPAAALKHLEVALKLDPKNADALKLRKDLAAELSIKKTGFETARTTHDLLRNKEATKDLDAAQRMHRTVEETGDIITRIRRQVDASPNDARLLRQLAKAQAASNLYDDSSATWKRILEIDPGDFDAKVQLGDLRISRIDRALVKAQQAGDKAEAARLDAERTAVTIEEYGVRVAEHPTDMALRFALGEQLLKAGRLDDAIAEFQKAVKDPRKRIDALGMLGECFIQKGLYDLAARQLEKALEESPGLNSERGKQVVYNLGVLREKQGDVAAAKEEFLKVYEVDVSFRDVADKVTRLSQK
jgi:tetratricopeptide (TPR) repeat protein